MECYLLKLVRMKQKVVFIEPADEEIKLFSSIEELVAWLVLNGFAYGQCKYFKYPEGEKVWYHKDNIPMEYIDVFITKMEIDDFADSKYKNLKELHMEWLPKLFE